MTNFVGVDPFSQIISGNQPSELYDVVFDNSSGLAEAIDLIRVASDANFVNGIVANKISKGSFRFYK